MFPEKNIPVISLSLDIWKTPKEHFEIWKKLKFLREEWVMIFWSGNIVHNLRELNWNYQNLWYNWAKEFNEEIKNNIIKNDINKIINYKNIKNSDKAIQWKEHFLPLLYILGVKNNNEQIHFFNDSIQMGSLSMTSIKIS